MLKSKTCHLKFVLLAISHLLGVKNGKRFGMKSNIAVIVAECNVKALSELDEIDLVLYHDSVTPEMF